MPLHPMRKFSHTYVSLEYLDETLDEQRLRELVGCPELESEATLHRRNEFEARLELENPLPQGDVERLSSMHRIRRA